MVRSLITPQPHWHRVRDRSARQQARLAHDNNGDSQKDLRNSLLTSSWDKSPLTPQSSTKLTNITPSYWGVTIAFPGLGKTANLSLYFESGVSYKHANVTLMLVSCLHALWWCRDIACHGDTKCGYWRTRSAAMQSAR